MLDDPHPEEWNPKYDSMFSAAYTEMHNVSVATFSVFLVFRYLFSLYV